MVKIKGPLFSESASGTVADCMTFSKRKSGQQVRFQRKQKYNLPSWKQADNQALYRLAYARWLSFSQSERDIYNNDLSIKNTSSSGWNLFLQKVISSPVTYLKLNMLLTFNRPDFSTVLDVSKNSLVGILKPTYPTNSPVYVPSKNAKLLNALSFNGSTNYVSVNQNSQMILGSGDFSIGCFIKCDVDISSHRTIFGVGLPTSIGQYSAYVVQTSGVLRFYCNNLPTFDTVKRFNDNLWHLVFYVRAGNSLSIIVDGVQEFYSDSGLADVDLYSSLPFVIGWRDTSRFFKGILDSFFYYKRALSLSEIVKIGLALNN